MSKILICPRKFDHKKAEVNQPQLTSILYLIYPYFFTSKMAPLLPEVTMTSYLAK
jgi:hypothetical protein